MPGHQRDVDVRISVVDGRERKVTVRPVDHQERNVLAKPVWSHGVDLTVDTQLSIVVAQVEARLADRLQGDARARESGQVVVDDARGEARYRDEDSRVADAARADRGVWGRRADSQSGVSEPDTPCIVLKLTLIIVWPANIVGDNICFAETLRQEKSGSAATGLEEKVADDLEKMGWIGMRRSR